VGLIGRLWVRSDFVEEKELSSDFHFLGYGRLREKDSSSRTVS